MPKKISPMKVIENSGYRFDSLESAQRAALPFLARDLAAIMRGMLADGTLEVRDGRIMPKG